VVSAEDKKGEFRFRLKAGNSEVVATGESYPTKAGVMKGIEANDDQITGRAIDQSGRLVDTFTIER